jgi:iron complex transport system substrate-binding protein
MGGSMFIKNKLFIVFWSLLLVSIFTSYCLASDIQITDTLGREVGIPQEINRILAVGCSLREVLSFDVADKIVGIEYREKAKTDEKDAPQGSDLPYMLAFPELYDLPVVNIGAGGSGYNHEVIVQLNPEIIFMGATDIQKVDDLQHKTRIPVVTVYTNPIGTPKQDETFYQSLKIIGEVLGKKDRAEELINIIETYKKDLSNRTKDIPDEQKLTAYIAGRAFYGSHGLTSTDPQWPPFNWINEPNVAYELSELSSGVNIDKEALIGWNPEVIFISPVSLSIIENELQTSPFKELKAIQENKVYYVLPFCWYSYNKENAIVDAYYVGKTIYPDVFQDINIDQKGVEIFKKFYGESGENAYYTLKDRFKAFSN